MKRFFSKSQDLKVGKAALYRISRKYLSFAIIFSIFFCLMNSAEKLKFCCPLSDEPHVMFPYYSQGWTGFVVESLVFVVKRNTFRIAYLRYFVPPVY
jgi:hypothetical protein